MLLKLLRKLGPVKTALVVTVAAVLSSFSLYLLSGLFWEDIIVPAGIALSTIVPAIVASTLSYLLVRLLHRLDLTERMLTEINNELELRVQERTVELARANEALQAEIAERKRMEEEIRRRNRELILLNRIIAATAASLEPEIILETTCRELALAFDVPQTGATLLNEDKSQAVVVAEYRADGQRKARQKVISVVGNPWFEHLLTLNTPLVTDDARSDPRLTPSGDLIYEQGITSLLLLPIIIEGEVVGSLELETIEFRHFSTEEVELASRVAEQTATALARAWLNEKNQELEEQYYQAQKMEAVGLLAGGIAHDFNNLLTAINGFAELILFRLPPGDPLQDLVNRILISGQRAADLVRQLLAFSRKQIIEPQVLNLNTVIVEMDQWLKRVISEDIELETILTSTLSPIKVDQSQIEHVIVNLVVNARDAMTTGGKLTIETTNVVLDKDYLTEQMVVQPGEYVLLAISDTGVGMSEALKARVFEPFFTTKELGKGSGLGLSTIYGIVKQNSGGIWIDSEEGQGTTFKIYLPCTNEVEQQLSSPA
jgi:signal transduction histidine kinase